MNQTVPGHTSAFPGKKDFVRSELVVIGSDDAATARAELSRISRFVNAVPGASLRDVAYTCAVESHGRPFKVAIVATSLGDLSDKLALAANRIDSGVERNSFNRGIYVGTGQCPAPGRTVFLFPGEGTQYPDMLRELALFFPACRAAFDAADTAVASATADFGPSVWPPPSHYIFPPASSRSPDIRTLPTPLAIQTVLAADSALLFLFTELGLAPDAVMGVGVGEIVALECAGAITLPEKRNRIRLLGGGYRALSAITGSKKTVPDCTTLSVAGLGRDALSAIVAPFGNSAAIAADQAPELYTIAVLDDARAGVEAALAAAGASLHPLPSVNKPFHTPMMEPCAGLFKRFFSEFVTAIPRIPVYSCGTQAPLSGATPQEIADAAALQWWNPIDVGKTVRRLYDDGFRVFVELGARGGLTACVSSTLRHLPHLAVAANRGHRPDMLQLHHALAALASHGAAFDPAILHKDRSSRLLDFGHPSDFRPVRRQQGRAIPHSLPILAGIPVPPGLVAAAPVAATTAVREGDAPSVADFPCIDFAEIVKFVPGDMIDLSLRFSPADFPYLVARSLSASPVSSYDKAMRGPMPIPVELMAEIMSEAARKLCPEKVAIRIEALESTRAVAFCDPLEPDLRIQARILSGGKAEATVEAAAYRRGSFGCDSPEAVASCRIVLADAYPEAPQPSPQPLSNPVRANWTHEDIYPARLPAGECCRALKSIAELGDNGLEAECFQPPRRGIVRSAGQPRFSTAPVCLGAASDALALLHSREPASGMLEIFAGAAKIEFFEPPPAEWESFSIRISSRPPKQDDVFVVAEAELSDADHRVAMRVTGLSNRIVRVSRNLHALVLDPISSSLSEAIPQQSLPSLPHEVVCRKVDDDWPDDEDEPLRLRIAAGIALSAAEMEKWRAIGGSRIRRHEWLFGRIAAKDAVRKCLLDRYGRAIGAADISIETDEAGKPSPQGPWRKTCGAPMDISITHTAGCVVAAAAPNASLGIDAERGDRAISEDFATFAFSQSEQEMAAESGDGATALFRFWCAKEALSKSLGTGLRYGPNDLSAQTLDIESGKVEMAATRLWLEWFPQLRGILVPVHTCLIGDLVLAVCALDRALVFRDSDETAAELMPPRSQPK